jgi:hypothetical protein
MARNTFIASINIQEVKESYCELGRLQGCNCCIAVRAYKDSGDRYSSSVAFVETSPFKSPKEVAEDIERTFGKLERFANAPHYKAIIIDADEFDELAVIAEI